ncbi:nucleotide-diphospho-sugar transferase domain-containing protein [Ditylenchus destructor]|uniref:Nucleotide-diphospho-sugar transferase domain-containing protein n=1 Tax=Ditylenchus destructor TaxID=166010 RepID=A0AAD4R1N0_9BILA|nr:nucleotide-diphospho-sugar transferase domain-containing protein [Ditylenchus destructor]
MKNSSAAMKLLLDESVAKSEQWDFEGNNELRKALSRTRSPAILLLNKEDRFGAGDGRYQLFQYFRARLATFLTASVPNFWMIQADTIWTENLFETIDVENPKYSGFDLIFDSEGETGMLASMVAGGYFFVRSVPATRMFFRKIGDTLLEYFLTDNNLMTRQCILALYGSRCGFIPYRIMTNWRGLSNYYGSNTNNQTPIFFQYDGGDSSEGKFELMRRQGYLFVKAETLADNSKGVSCRTKDEYLMIRTNLKGRVEKPAKLRTNPIMSKCVMKGKEWFALDNRVKVTWKATNI